MSRLRRHQLLDIIDAKDQLAAGNTSVALSLLNDAISFIDSASNVVTGSEHRP